MPRDYRANRAAAQVELANALRLVGGDTDQIGAYQAALEDLRALNDAFSTCRDSAKTWPPPTST